MPIVVALKSFRAGKGAKLILQGQSVDVDEGFADVLISRGIATSADSVVEETTEEVDVADQDDEADSVVEETVDEKPEPSGDYPALPAKSAPLAEWEEYARKHSISLSGLRNRNEKMAYIRKVVAGE